MQWQIRSIFSLLHPVQFFYTHKYLILYKKLHICHNILQTSLKNNHSSHDDFSMTSMSIHLDHNPCCDFKIRSRLKWAINFGLAVRLRRRVLWLLAVPNWTLNYCEICSAAYVYVMITNWFQLLLNAAIQLPSGPSVSVSVCMCVWERDIEWNQDFAQVHLMGTSVTEIGVMHFPSCRF